MQQMRESIGNGETVDVELRKNRKAFRMCDGFEQDASMHNDIVQLYNSDGDRNVDVNIKTLKYNNRDEACCICLDPLQGELVIFPCDHAVHVECAMEMSNRMINTCPFCGQKLSVDMQNQRNCAYSIASTCFAVVSSLSLFVASITQM
jgi:hypothetical protein